MKKIDIGCFRLPRTPVEEVWFEEPRDIERVVVTFKGVAPAGVKLFYLRKNWPGSRVEQFDADARQDPVPHGWIAIDDHHNTEWQRASTKSSYK